MLLYKLKRKKHGELFSETGLSCHKFLLRIQVYCYSRGLKSVPLPCYLGPVLGAMRGLCPVDGGPRAGCVPLKGSVGCLNGTIVPRTDGGTVRRRTSCPGNRGLPRGLSVYCTCFDLTVLLTDNYG